MKNDGSSLPRKRRICLVLSDHRVPLLGGFIPPSRLSLALVEAVALPASTLGLVGLSRRL